MGTQFESADPIFTDVRKWLDNEQSVREASMTFRLYPTRFLNDGPVCALYIYLITALNVL